MTQGGRTRIAKARFFFALRPDVRSAATLATLAGRLAARHGGRALVAADMHATLAFVGMRPLTESTMLAGLLEGLPASIPHDAAATDDSRECEAPPLALVRLGSFGHGVLWIGPGATPGRPASDAEPARRIADALRARLRGAAVAFDDRPLRIHVTLVRGARESGLAEALEQAIVPARWSVALGSSDASATALDRYRWRTAGRSG